VDDPDAVTLAEYQGSGLPSLAVKSLNGWKSVFVGDPVLPLEMLRGICRYAGVHLWTTHGEDVTAVGDGWIMVHASRDGHRTLHLPEPTGLYDVTEQRLIADEAREYRFFLRLGTTRLFCIGATERLHRLGLPNLSLPGDGRARIVLETGGESRRESARERFRQRSERAPDAVEPRPEQVSDSPPELLPEPTEIEARRSPAREASVPHPTHDDLATLEAVLKMDISAYEDIEFEEAEDQPRRTERLEPVPVTGALAGLLDESEPGGSRKRRRRRGGRGRGRKHPGESEGNEDGPTASNGAEPAGE
jgi:hypothetical protein